MIWQEAKSPTKAIGVEELPYPYVATLLDADNNQLTLYIQDEAVFSQLYKMYITNESKWVIGIVVSYPYNPWNFILDPVLGTAEQTIEVCQTSIRLIAEHLEYWLNQMACIWGRIIEAYERQLPE